MKRPLQVLLNVLLYAALAGLAVRSTFVDRDLWFAVVTWLLIAVALVITLAPGLHVTGVSPGRFPDDEAGTGGRQ